MRDTARVDRRQFLRRVASGAAFTAALGTLPWLAGCGGDDGIAQSTERHRALKGLADRLAVARNADARAATLGALDALGGAKAFVRSGDRVVVKPNIGWAKAPRLAANTNPVVVAALAEAFLAAGAAEVLVFDRTCNDAKLAYRLSGIAEAAEDAGATVIRTRASRFTTVAFGGEDAPEQGFDRWPIFEDAVTADLLVNVPVAKHHNLSGVTLGLKNLMGVMGGDRGDVHRYLHEAIGLLGTGIRPHLTVLDASRMLVAGGPSGGDPANVVEARTLVAGVDPVAVDAWGCEKLPWRSPVRARDRRFLEFADRLGVGERDLARKTVLNA